MVMNEGNYTKLLCLFNTIIIYFFLTNFITFFIY